METINMQTWQDYLLNSADITIISTDTNGIIQSCNVGALKKLGYQAEELVGKTTPAILHDIDEVIARAGILSQELGCSIAVGFEVFVAKARLGLTDENEWSYIRKDGSRFWVRLSVTAIYDQAQQLVGFLGIGKDISELKSLQLIAKESEDRFRALADASFEAIVITQKGHIVQANYNFCRLFGHEMSEVDGLTPLNFTAPCDQKRVKALVLAGEEQPFFFQGMRKDGTFFDAEARCRTIYYQGKVARVASIQDVTERLQKERALQQSEHRYRDLFENANDLIQSVTPEGQILFVNRAWRDTLGYSVNEIKHLSVFEVIHPDSQAHCMDTFRKILQGALIERVEAAFISKDGRKILVEGSINCSFENGRPVATRSIFRDVTQRKADEAKILEQSQKLTEANHLLHVLAVTDALTGLKNRRAMDDLLSGEFTQAQQKGTPLSLILLDVDHFKSYNDTFGHPAGDEVLRKLAEILSRVARASDIVARYGGEEFMIILPHTGRKGALRLAERCRQDILSAAWPHRGISASFGIAVLDLACMASVSTLIEHADQALYHAKSLGRNCVV
ncbi:MAG: PAS domain S-box protein [Flavobacteriales bacterium]